MARAVIQHEFADGDTVRVAISSDVDYADVYDELTSRVIRMYREAVLDLNEVESE